MKVKRKFLSVAISFTCLACLLLGIIFAVNPNKRDAFADAPSGYEFTWEMDNYNQYLGIVIPTGWEGDSSKVLSFDYYGDMPTGTQFSFGDVFGGTHQDRCSNKFSFNSDGTIKALDGANSGKQIGSYVDAGNGWKTATIDIASIGATVGGKQIKSIRSSGSVTIYVKNVKYSEPSPSYNPADDAELTWKLNNENQSIGKTIESGWENKDCSISFDFYGDIPSGTFSFGPTYGAGVQSRCTNKFSFVANGVIKALDGKNEGKAIGSYVDADSGWKTATINLKELGASSGNQVITAIRATGSSGSLYVKNVDCEIIENSYTIAQNVTVDLGFSITNWLTQTIQFEMNLFDGVARRFIFRDSTDIVHGFIKCYTDKLEVENPKGNPYMIEATTKPVNLGNGWYRFTLDMSEVKPQSRCNGSETITRIKSYAESNVNIEIRNLKVISTYDPTQETGIITLTGSNNITAISDVLKWGTSVIAFDVYHGTLDYSCDPQFLFTEKRTNTYLSSFFGYKDIGGIGLYLRNSGSGDYWKKSSNKPSYLGKGWYRWEIDLSELRVSDDSHPEYRDKTVGGIFNRGANGVYIKNFTIVSGYDPADDADTTWELNNYNQALGININAGWENKDCSISFDFYGDIPSRTFSFGPTYGADDQSRCTNKFSFVANGAINALDGKNEGKAIGSYVDAGNGWKTATINLKELGASSGNQVITAIRATGSSGSLYVKNVTFVLNYKPEDDADIICTSSYTDLDSTNYILKQDWFDGTNGRDSKITFDFYWGNISTSQTFSFAQVGESNRVTGKFKFNTDGKIYNEDLTTQVGSYVDASNGWKTATISMQNLGGNGSNTNDIRFIRIDSISENFYIKNFSFALNFDSASLKEYTWTSNAYSTVPDVAHWGSAVISFEVYHDSLDQDSDPQFIFAPKGLTGSNFAEHLSAYFGYKNINRTTALWLRTSAQTGYWVQSTNQPEYAGCGWYKWTIDLSELGSEGEDRNATIGTIYNRGSKDVYVKNFTVVTPGYDPATYADMTWGKNNNKIVDHDKNDVVIYDWAIRETTIEFDIFELPQASNTLSFGSEKSGEKYGLNSSQNIGSDNRISAKCSFGAGGKIYLDKTSTVVGSYALDEETGWYHVEINATSLIDLGIDNGKAVNKALRFIRMATDTPLYVKNFDFSYGEKTYDVKVEMITIQNVSKNGFVDLGKVDLWRNQTLKFKSFGTICNDIGLSHDGQIHEYSGKKLGYTLTYSFSCRNGVVGSHNGGDTFNAIDGCTCTSIGDNWYQWEIPFEALTVIQSSMSGIDATSTPLTHLWFSANVFYNACFIKDIQIINDAIDMEDGASIRISNPSGIRFTSTIDVDSSLLDGATNIKKGTLVLPTDLLDGKLLTIDNAKAIKIPAEKFLNPEGTKFTGVLVDIPEEGFGRSLTARGYISFTKGGKDYVIYSDSQTRSISEVAIGALEDVKETLDSEHGYTEYVVINGVYSYSPYTQSQINIIKNFVEPDFSLTTVYNGGEVDLANEIIREYISNKNDESALASMLATQSSEKVYADNQNIVFSWENTGVQETFTIIFASDANFENVLFTYETNNNYVDNLGIFIPGETYYYRVIGQTSGKSTVDSFTAKDLPVRYINAGTVLNMRDLGGWTTEDGTQKVKYGLLYRGGSLDGFEEYSDSLPQYMIERGDSRLDDYGKKVFNDYLGIKGEIDLRGGESDLHNATAFGENQDLLCQYEDSNPAVLWTNLNDATLKSALKEYFTFLADEDNYPIYFHCNGGADRTGAFAFLVNGLLGVGYEDLAVDYELTSFSKSAGENRVRSTIETCYETLLAQYSQANGNLKLAIELYLKDCGVTDAQISSIRAIMLEAN